MKALIIGCALISATCSAQCFLDDSNTIRCASGKAYEGVSYAVFTADTPFEVLEEMDRRHNEVDVPYLRHPENLMWPNQKKVTVNHVRIDVENYPDITCFDFHSKGKKRSQTCFDTMEITER